MTPTEFARVLIALGEIRQEMIELTERIERLESNA